MSVLVQTEPILNENQRRALEPAAQPGYRKHIKKLCQEVGITPQAFYLWMKPGHPFRRCWEALPQEMVRVQLPGIVAALQNKALDGDVQAAELLFEYLGLLTQRHEVTHIDTSGIESALAQKLGAVIDVSAEPVDD